VAAAEDALAEAFAKALIRWPIDGIPASPEGWLMTAARRELLQRERRARVERAPRVLAFFDDEAVAPNGGPDRAYLELRAGNPQDAQAALQRALGSTSDPRRRAHLQAAAPNATES
jgi:predicted RNA polymerase sigma factor